MGNYFPDDSTTGFVLYQFHTDYCAFDLPLTKVVDAEAWEAAVSKDSRHGSVTDLPITAWPAEVDQPAFKITELGSWIVSEFKELEVAAFRRNGAEMQDIMARVKLQIRAVEALVRLQKEAIESDY